MNEVDTLTAKLREAEDTIRQLQARLKEVEAERDRYGQIQLPKPLWENEWISVADWCKDVDQFVQDCTTGPTYPLEDIIREIEERAIADGLMEPDEAGKVREPAA